MTKAQFRKLINKSIAGKATGFFSDDHWAGQRQIVDTIAQIPEVEMTLLDCSYDWDGNKNCPTSKRWSYELLAAGSTTTCHLLIMATGAGTVSNPLSRYDIVAYAS